MASKTISVELKKKTIQMAVNQIDMLRAMDMGKHREGDAMFELVKEIKKDIRKQVRDNNKVDGWKEFWNFWPLSIVVPLMLLSIILGPYFTR